MLGGAARLHACMHARVNSSCKIKVKVKIIRSSCLSVCLSVCLSAVHFQVFSGIERPDSNLKSFAIQKSSQKTVHSTYWYLRPSVRAFVRIVPCTNILGIPACVVMAAGSFSFFHCSNFWAIFQAMNALLSSSLNRRPDLSISLSLSLFFQLYYLLAGRMVG